MLRVALVLLAVSRAAVGQTPCEGQIVVKGLSSSAYLGGSGGSVAGDTLTIKHNSGFSMFSECDRQEWRPEAIAQLSLLGKAISFDVDLSKVGCGCNLAFYLISSPAHDYAGGFSSGDDGGGQPPYYCDANMVGGQWCPEIDIMEANDHAFQATTHNCESPMNKHYSYCDRSGCSQNTRDMPNAYGPGSTYTIDTTQPFSVLTEFPQSNGALAGMRTTLSQQGKQVKLDHASCDSSYLAKLSDAMRDGMSLRITYWGESANTMAWLDSPPCGGGICSGDAAGDATISNIEVTEGAEVAPEPSGPSQGAITTATPAPPSGWVSNLGAPWLCHHYVGNQQETQWCQASPFEDGWEFKYTGGVQSLCGPCWCCKRQAMLAEAPTMPEWALAPAPTTTKAPEPAVAMQGPLLIGGMPKTYLAGTGGGVEGARLTVKHNAGWTVFAEREDSWEPANIQEFLLLGKTIVYTVDLSKVDCACNLAFYLISMPAVDMAGNPSAGTNRGGQPAYYCDANMVGGQWCPEIDIMEANNHAFQATLHRCDPPINMHYSYCDRGGCAQSTRDTANSYGPGSQYTIDTTQRFDVETEFPTNDGELIGMKTTLRQHGRNAVLDHKLCNKEYLAKLSEAMKHGMSLRITYWGSEAQTMAWMDVPPCGAGSCSGEFAGDAVISNIRVLVGTVADRALVWVVSDRSDAMFGQLVPREVEMSAAQFVGLEGQGIAQWGGQRHFALQMPRAEVEARIAAMIEFPEGSTFQMLSQSLPCDGLQGPCEVSTHTEGSAWNNMIVSYSPLASKVPTVILWPLHIGLFVAVAAAVVTAATLIVKRVQRSHENRHGTQMKRGPMDAFFARSGASPARASPGGPGTPGSSSRAAAGDVPSPMRRLRSTLIGSPANPKNTRGDMLALLESCIE